METRDVRYIGSTGVRNQWGKFVPGVPVPVPVAAAELLTAQKYFEYAEGTPDAPSELGRLNKEELLGIATDLEIEGRTNMTKAELVRAIEEARNEEGS